jgi:predicted dehydrogenase
MQVAVLGHSERAEAHRDWYRRAGVAVVPAAADAGPAAEADLYDLCDAGALSSRVLGGLLRRRRLALLVAGNIAAVPGEVERLAQAAARRRHTVAVVGGWRWVPAMARLRELVVGGTLGTVRAVDVRVAAAPAQASEVFLGALDLGLWLAAAEAPVAESAELLAVAFRAGAASVTVRMAEDATVAEPTWTVHLAADLGQAAANAQFLPGTAGRDCRRQMATVTRDGRPRELLLPTADPAGSELAAVLARLRTGQPWLAVCLAERAAALARLRAPSR